jgi:2-C-methyl-D-erythritol 4-phosphate cytidylyltransferase
MTAALIVAAGSATRMGFDKLLAPLGSQPVLQHTIQAFQACPEIDAIWVVCSDSRRAAVDALGESIPKFRGTIPGGSQRHLSVWNGLSALPDTTTLVAIHDGARPLIQPAQISRCLAAARTSGAAASAHRITDTLQRATPEGIATGPVDRTHLWAMETPQVFQTTLIRQAYQQILRDTLSVTDEVSAATHAGIPVQLVENPSPNLKITQPGDLATAAALLP